MIATVIIERGADGTHGAYIADGNLPFGAIGDGKTVADFKNSIKEMKEYYESLGKGFPNVLFDYKYDME